jgi:hypothetical protein
LGYFKAGINKTWRDQTLIPRQLKALRNTPNIHGAVYFSSKSFINNPLGWNDTLRNNFYRYPALVPPIEGITGELPPSPNIVNVTISDNRKLHFSVIAPAGSSRRIRQVGLYARYSAAGDFSRARLIETRPFADTVSFSIEHPASAEYVQYYLTYVNPENQEGIGENKQPASVRLVKKKNGDWFLE